MRSFLLLLVLGAAWATPAAAGASPDDALAPYLAFGDDTVALVGVGVIDGSGGPVRRDQTVIVKGDTIAAIGDAGAVPIPAGARMLELQGHTVIPGMVGMHDHTHMPGVPLMRTTAPRLWLAAGVTTVQTAGSADAAGELALAAEIEAGRVPGPRIFASSPYVTGPRGNAPMDKPATPALARAFVREWAQQGATWIKLYRHVQPDIAAATIAEAHEQGLKVTGHLCSLSFSEAASMGIDRIEHGLISATDFVAGRAPGECASNREALRTLAVDGEPVQAMIHTLVREGVVVTSTLAIVESHFPHRPQGDPRALRAMAPALREAYAARQARLQAGEAGTWTPELFARLLAFERAFVAAGGTLVAGPDTGRHVLPGFGNQRGFELLVEAGFPVPEAVRIVSSNGAKVLGIGGRVGALRTGMRADLVVLRGDLAADASAIRDARLVFRGGRAFDPARLLAEVRGRVGAPE